MILVFLTISILLCVTGLIINMKTKYHWKHDTLITVLNVVGVIGIVITICTVCYLTNDVKYGSLCKQKIEMYQQENSTIETKIDTLVSQYMQHETKTFSTVRGKGMNLISLFPELKSDKLVIQQMKIYNQNKKQIKKLKEQQIDICVARWWLYFG